MGSGGGVVLFLRRRRVSCQRPWLVGGGGGERINRDELILQRKEISRHLQSKFALSLIFFFIFPSNLPSSIPSYPLCGFELLFPETQWIALTGRS